MIGVLACGWGAAAAAAASRGRIPPWEMRMVAGRSMSMMEKGDCVDYAWKPGCAYGRNWLASDGTTAGWLWVVPCR